MSVPWALNFDRWPILGQPSILPRDSRPLADTWEGEVDYLRDWVEERVDYLSTAYAPDMPLIRSASHVADVGWQPPVTNGMFVGTTGRSLLYSEIVMRAIFAASSPIRSRSVMVLTTVMIMRRSLAAG